MSSYRDDYTHEDGREGGVSGQLVPDESGYLRAVFTPTTRKALRDVFSKNFSTTLSDYEKVDARRQANLKAYEAISDKGEAITIPIVKRDVNQQLAWLVDAMATDPPFSVKALDTDPVEIIIADGGQPQIVKRNPDEYAAELQALVNFYLIHKLRFRKTFKAWAAELLRDGNRPPILKVVYDEREREVGTANVIQSSDGQIERIERDPILVTVRDGEATRIEAVPGDQFFVPLPCDDIQRAPFVFQRYTQDTATIKDKIARGVYDFCGSEDQEDRDLVLNNLPNSDALDKFMADGRRPSDPLLEHTLYELHFDYPFAEVSEDGSTVSMRMIPFCAVVHAVSNVWLNCYQTFYWDRKRHFFAGRMQDRPFSFAGYSTTENVAPFQRLISQLFHAQLQNLAVSNVKVFMAREGSPTFKFLTKGGAKLRPGLVIPFREADDVKPEALGTAAPSMAAEIAFLNSESEKMSVVTEYDRGAIPSRTPVGTVTAVDQLAKMQPKMILDNIRDVLSEVVECFVRTLAQFNPGGVAVPFRDPNTKEGRVSKIVGFPLEWKEGAFHFDITATGDEETPQAITTTTLMLSEEVRKFNGDALGISGTSFMPGTPPPLMIFAANRIKGLRNILAKVFTVNKLNPDDYLPTQQEIDSLPLELIQMQMQMQQMGAAGMLDPMAGEMGAMDGQVPDAGPGADIPPGDGGGAPMGGMEEQPGAVGAIAGGASGALPPEF